MKKLVKNKKGFTLIELIVVIAILAILALIAIPRLTGFQDKAKLSADASTAGSISKTIAIALADDVFAADTDFDLNVNATTGEGTWAAAVATTMNRYFSTTPTFKYKDNMDNGTMTWSTDANGTITAPASLVIKK